MHVYLIRRTITVLITVFIVTTIVFFVLRMIPGDPVQLILGIEAPDERVQEVRTLPGLDRPIYLQYLIWLKDVCLGKFGSSLRSEEPVISMLWQRLPVTFWITTLALIISLAIALPLGILSALKPWSWIDVLSVFIAQLGLAVSMILKNKAMLLGLTILAVLVGYVRFAPLIISVPPDQMNYGDLFSSLRKHIYPALPNWR
jgi:peptide/nickel transport system permease protein